MTDRKACLRCGRNIDSYARICPFCNWDQNAGTPPPREEAVAGAPAYRPPSDRPWAKVLLASVGGLVLVVAMFAIGMHIHGSSSRTTTTSSKQAAASVTAPAVGRGAPRANVTLVPDTGSTSDVDQPITSAPAPQQAQGVPTEYQRTDATAASSDEYAQMAQRAQAERRKVAAAAVAELRTPVAPRRKAPEPDVPADTPQNTPAAAPQPDMTSAAATPPPQPAPHVTKSQPVAEYQPLPDIHVKQNVTAVLDLIVGADGHVREVTVRQPVPGETGKLVAAVQRWRFKPATENGVPVQAPFTVDISFKPDE
jgi:TonB family protein